MSRQAHVVIKVDTTKVSESFRRLGEAMATMGPAAHRADRAAASMMDRIREADRTIARVRHRHAVVGDRMAGWAMTHPGTAYVRGAMDPRVTRPVDRDSYVQAWLRSGGSSVCAVAFLRGWAEHHEDLVLR